MWWNELVRRWKSTSLWNPKKTYASYYVTFFFLLFKYSLLKTFATFFHFFSFFFYYNIIPTIFNFLLLLTLQNVAPFFLSLLLRLLHWVPQNLFTSLFLPPYYTISRFYRSSIYSYYFIIYIYWITYSYFNYFYHLLSLLGKYTIKWPTPTWLIIYLNESNQYGKISLVFHD